MGSTAFSELNSRLPLLFLLGVALAACKSMTPGGGNGVLPPTLPAAAGGLSNDEIGRSRNLYIAKCAKCHGFFHPANYTDGDWAYWMETMSRKSKIGLDEEELLSRYLGAFRSASDANTE